MRARLLICVIAILACVKRITPDPGGTRTAYSGVALRFGEQQAVPEGTRILWDFGDGTPEQEGPSVVHVFRRSGVYTVVETIRDKDGQTRSARTHVTALRQTVQMAVPADARAALMVPTPWSRMAIHREVAAKLSMAGFLDDLAGSVSAVVGFDVLDGASVETNGIDPDEGFAFFTLPQDPEALVLAVGTSDDAKSLQAAKRLLAAGRAMGRYGGGPFEVSNAELDGVPVLLGRNAKGDRIGILQHLGYLYLRLAGASDPLLALRAVAANASGKGLAADAGFAGALRHVGNGDAVFYSRAPDRAAGGSRFSSEVGSSAFAVVEKPENRELVQVRMFAQLKNLAGDALVAAFQPKAKPPDLASRLPGDAAAFLRISAAPQALWNELTRAAGPDAVRMRERVQEVTGLDLEKDLIPSFAGNVGIGVYLDASSLIEAVLGEQVGSLDRSAFVVAAQLISPQTVRAALERAMKSRPAADRAEVNGASWFRLGDGAQAAVRDDVFFLALGGQPPSSSEQPRSGRGRKKEPKPPPKAADLGVLGRVLMLQSPSLGQHFKRIGVVGFEVPGQQNVWVDVAGIVRSIERAAGAQGGVAGQAARIFAERAADLRDALFEARPGKEGFDADLWVRFAPPRKASAR
jgi:hypothetical protein